MNFDLSTACSEWGGFLCSCRGM